MSVDQVRVEQQSQYDAALDNARIATHLMTWACTLLRHLPIDEVIGGDDASDAVWLVDGN